MAETYTYTRKTWVNGEVIYEEALNNMEEGIVEALKAAQTFSSHAANKNNPHGVTAEQIGAAGSSHKHSVSDLSDTLGVAGGGTGKTAWTANRLLYASAANALAQLAFPSTAGSVLRQGKSGAPYWTTLSDLASAMGACQIQKGTYTGTGTYGSSNPTKLTFNFTPKIVFVYPNTTTGVNSPILFPMINGMPDGHGVYISNASTGYYVGMALTVSWSGTTVSFYSSHSTATIAKSSQMNQSGLTYSYVALG